MPTQSTNGGISMYPTKYYRAFYHFTIISLVIVFLCNCKNSEEENLYSIALKEVWIPMPDGTRLAADLYLPVTDDSNETFPVLLEYLPYRKDEHRKLRYPVFSYFVKRGYVVARVDIRGTGRSEGELIEYEYTDQEQEDGEEVIQWLSEQDFSTGSVGMFGISWGGFNAIHLAMRQPPALKAILSMMATDDIYEDDVHFIDGMMHVDAYEIGRDLKNVIPGAPDFIVDDEYFEEKFDTEPWLLKYKRQQRDGLFWDRASLNADYSKLKTPILMISGYYDGYRDSSPRILQHVNAPKKAIIGPWNHTFPHMATPPPSIEWRAEAVRWFDHWLKGVDNGILDEPAMAVFIRDGHGPSVPDSIAGSWEWVEEWPSEKVDSLKLYLQDEGRLDSNITEIGQDVLDYIPSAGIEASGSVMWWGDWSPDLRNSDEYSLVYETEPLEEDIQILGFPKLNICTSVDVPQAHFIGRLSDVSASGEVTLVTGAGINGSHRNSSSSPEHLIPGQTYQLKIEMHFTSWTFKKGNKLRVAMSNGQWPMIWPTPSPIEMTVYTGGVNPSSLSLPIWKGRGNHRPQFKVPGKDPKLPGYETKTSGTVSGFAEVSETKNDTIAGITQVIASNEGTITYPWATWKSKEHIIHQVNDHVPAKASVKSNYEILINNDHQKLKWEGILNFWSDESNFYYEYSRRLSDQDSLIRIKTWKDTIPRDFQ
ncbi:MAG: CocE/NonD family hydrolase [Saprospiraceae bacterium]|nr:CocE/NonD family hydrolase [Saprospiraceae bacterium]